MYFLFLENLNATQQKSVEFCLKRDDLAVIHGPPGTGKTTVLIEIIKQHVKLGAKVCKMYFFIINWSRINKYF